MTPKTDVATPETNGKTHPVSAVDLDEKSLYLGTATGAADPEADAKAIVARILTADTAEEIFGGPGNLLNTEDIVGKPFTLHNVEFRASDIEGGAGAYAILHVSPWGQAGVVMVTCGSRNVMGAAYRGKEVGLLPRGPLTIVEGKQTRRGFTPLWLQDMSEAQADAMSKLTVAFATPKDDPADELPF